MTMELPKIEEEKNAYRNMILSSEDGKGTISTGNFYHVEYEPYTPNKDSLKCEGITLTVKRNDLGYYKDLETSTVLFKNKELTLLESLNGTVPTPFKVRFKEEVERMKKVVTDFDEHNRKVKETAEKVVQCKMNIDNLVSEITNGESMPYVKLMESTMKALPEGSPEPEKKPEMFMMGSIDSKKPFPTASGFSSDTMTNLEQINRKTWHQTDYVDKCDRVSASRSKWANESILNAEYRVRG